MIPILYDKYETDFLSNGLGQLGDCLTCTVTEEINGIYELEFTYPMSGAYYEQLINYGGVVACTHDHNGDVQLFDIYKYTAPIDGIVTFYGSHVSYRLADYIYGGPPIIIPDSRVALDYIFEEWTYHSTNARFLPLGSFTFHNETTYDDKGGYFAHTTGHYVVRDAMLNKSENNGYLNGSILQRWKGEWKFDNFDVYYYNKRGSDRGVQIRYGKNMSAVQRERDTSGIVSVIVAYWSNSDHSLIHTYEPVYYTRMESDTSPWYANGEQVFSGDAFFFKPPIIHAQMMDVSSEFDTEPTQETIDSYCRAYMRKNRTWSANDNITVEFLDLYGTPEYENIRGLSDCRLGDSVSIMYPQLGIVSDGIEIMSLTYDVLADRVTQMQLNTIRTTLAQVIIDSIGG